MVWEMRTEKLETKIKRKVNWKYSGKKRILKGGAVGYLTLLGTGKMGRWGGGGADTGDQIKAQNQL